jgi:hypothetical protein
LVAVALAVVPPPDTLWPPELFVAVALLWFVATALALEPGFVELFTATALEPSLLALQVAPFPAVTVPPGTGWPMTVPERQMPSPRAVPAGTNTAAVNSASIAMSRRPARIFLPSRSNYRQDVRGFVGLAMSKTGALQSHGWDSRR